MALIKDYLTYTKAKERIINFKMPKFVNDPDDPDDPSCRIIYDINCGVVNDLLESIKQEILRYEQQVLKI